MKSGGQESLISLSAGRGLGGVERPIAVPFEDREIRRRFGLRDVVSHDRQKRLPRDQTAKGRASKTERRLDPFGSERQVNAWRLPRDHERDALAVHEVRGERDAINLRV